MFDLFLLMIRFLVCYNSPEKKYEDTDGAAAFIGMWYVLDT